MQGGKESKSENQRSDESGQERTSFFRPTTSFCKRDLSIIFSIGLCTNEDSDEEWGCKCPCVVEPSLEIGEC